MRVKTTFAIFLSLSFAACGTGAGGGLEIRQLDVRAGRPAGYGSLYALDTGLVAAFSDAESASLSIAEVPFSRFSVPAPVEASFSDVVAKGAFGTSGFGVHAGAVVQGLFNVLYLDRRRDESAILKWLVRGRDGGWTAEVMEKGASLWPLAVLEDNDGNAVPFWISGSSIVAHFPGAESATILAGASPGGYASAGRKGFSYYDPSRRALKYYALSGQTLQEVEIEDGGPVHCAGRTREGFPAVLTYSPHKKRLFLFERAANDGPMGKTTVVSAEDAHSVFFTPREEGYVFSYDAAGKDGYSLHLLFQRGRRYERFIVAESAVPIQGFSAVLHGNAFYALVMGGGLKLVEARLPN